MRVGGSAVLGLAGIAKVVASGLISLFNDKVMKNIPDAAMPMALQCRTVLGEDPHFAYDFLWGSQQLQTFGRLLEPLGALVAFALSDAHSVIFRVFDVGFRVTPLGRLITSLLNGEWDKSDESYWNELPRLVPALDIRDPSCLARIDRNSLQLVKQYVQAVAQMRAWRRTLDRMLQRFRKFGVPDLGFLQSQMEGINGLCLATFILGGSDTEVALGMLEHLPEEDFQQVLRGLRGTAGRIPDFFRGPWETAKEAMLRKNLEGEGTFVYPWDVAFEWERWLVVEKGTTDQLLTQRWPEARDSWGRALELSREIDQLRMHLLIESARFAVQSMPLMIKGLWSRPSQHNDYHVLARRIKCRSANLLFLNTATIMSTLREGLGQASSYRDLMRPDGRCARAMLDIREWFDLFDRNLPCLIEDIIWQFQSLSEDSSHLMGDQNVLLGEVLGIIEQVMRGLDEVIGMIWTEFEPPDANQFLLELLFHGMGGFVSKVEVFIQVLASRDIERLQECRETHTRLLLTLDTVAPPVLLYDDIGGPRTLEEFKGAAREGRLALILQQLQQCKA